MVRGIKTNRTHHYLSDLGYHWHLLAEHNPNVTDIREQFALLPWAETQMIAAELGIRHPVYPRTKTPTVMTSDLVLTLGSEQVPSYRIFCIQQHRSIDSNNPRATHTMEKLLIEKTYWERQGIPWHLVTNQDLPKTRVRNLDLLRTSMIATELDWLNSHLQAFLGEFKSVWSADADGTFLWILGQVASTLGLSREDCFHLFARAVWLRLLHVDLDSEIIHYDKPLCHPL